jgi:hypothetical protein
MQPKSHARKLNQTQAAAMAQATKGRARVVPSKKVYNRKGREMVKSKSW